MFKTVSLISLSFLFTLVCIVVPFKVFADQPNYTVLSPLPGTTVEDTSSGQPCPTNNASGVAGCTATLGTYLPGLFNLLIGLGAVAAFVLITLWGFEYMFSDSINMKKTAKGHLIDVAWGLAIVVFAWIILNTLNPNLVKGNFSIAALPNSTDSTLQTLSTALNPCSDPNSSVCSVEQTDEQVLKGIGIPINTPCTATNCPTQVAGLNAIAMGDLGVIAKGCTNCNLTLTGGSEVLGHSTTGSHPTGNAVDLTGNQNLNNYLGVPSPQAGQTYQVTINGQSVTALYEVTGTQAGGSTSSGVHWHLSF